MEKLYKVDKWAYFNQIGYMPHAKQRLFHASEARFKVPVCGRRFGKLLSCDTLIPTPTGMVEIGNIFVGDQVFDETGKICQVIGVSETQWRIDAYKVTFDDGNVLYAHGEHEWLTFDKKARRTRNITNLSHPSDNRRKPVAAEVRTTKEILATLKVNGETNHAIQLTEPVEFPKRILPIDPYVLGVWLGDGTTSNGTITIPDKDSWIINKIISRGYRVTRNQYGDKCPSWTIHRLITELRENLILNNKHIPLAYLYSSIEQREDLLHGLMDTDGSVAPNHVDFDNVNKKLADSVDYLICSLGGKVTRSERIGMLYGIPKKKCYRVHTNNIIDVFSLPRKLSNQQKLPRRKNYYRFIVSIEKTL